MAPVGAAPNPRKIGKYDMAPVSGYWCIKSERPLRGAAGQKECVARAPAGF